MDKYEYQVCTEQIKKLISEKRFTEAMEIADTIDWRRVRSVSMLVTVSEIYKVNKRYEDAKDILLLAYERHPNGRDIVYALCELFIKLGDVVQAIESYKEFMAVAPDDPNSYILLYKIYKAQDVSLEEQIDVLEEYKRRDYREKWAYELASLYHKTGQEAKCIAECDELILWFGEGKYVRKAMELKMQHTALSKDQQAKYDGRAVTTSLPSFDQPLQQNNSQFGNNAQQTGPMLNQYGEYIQQTGSIGTTGALDTTGQIDQGQMVSTMQNPYGTGQMQPVYVDAYGNPISYDAYGNPIQITPDMYQDSSQPIQVTPGMNHLGMTQDIMTQALGTGVWNTVDLQDHLSSQVREVMEDVTENQEIQDEQEEIKAEPIKPAISVNTGVIDLSDADLSLGVAQSEATDNEESSDDTSAETESGEASSMETEPSVDIMSQLDGIIPSVAPVDDKVDAKEDTDSDASDKEDADDTPAYKINDVVETPDEEISRISAIQEKAFPGYKVPDIVLEKEEQEEATTDEQDDTITVEKDMSEEVGHYPYDTVTDIGYVEELPEIDQPEDVEEILKTGKIPTDEISKAVAYETDSIEEVDELEVDEVDDDDDSQMPSYMRGDIRAKREFDDDEYRIFCRYDGMENMKAQLVEALDRMSMDPTHGNIVIMGPESADCKGIAINIVKAMQSKNPMFSGKVAKISGEALNKKNIKLTLEKLENGALIVERAGGLTHDSVVLITNTLMDSDKQVIVIFEGIREHVKPLFKYTKHMKTVFDARIDIAEYTNEDLVNYGRGYALEKEYSIDEMGGLALHNRISEMQTFDHKVTIEEVKEIIDAAISHVDRKNMGHFMDMLLGRRYDDMDNIILGEKDFIF